MNVYDFDKTIYYDDSTVDFCKYCIRRRPSCLLTLPGSLAALLRYKAGRLNKTEMKQIFYRLLRHTGGTERMIADFWQQNEGKLKQWYLRRWRKDDVIISASPEFLLRPVCDRLGVTLIASRVDPDTGEYSGLNCDGREKVRRFRELFPDAVIDEFYSDSHSDDPLARIAKRAFMVRGDTLSPWRFEDD